MIFLPIVCSWFYRLISTKLYLTLPEKKWMQYGIDYVWSLFLSSEQYTYKVEVCKFSWRGNWRYSLEKGLNYPLLFGILIQAPSDEGPEIWFRLLFMVKTADFRITADDGLERTYRKLILELFLNIDCRTFRFGFLYKCSAQFLGGACFPAFSHIPFLALASR